jgi:hypothetical protein
MAGQTGTATESIQYTHLAFPGPPSDMLNALTVSSDQATLNLYWVGAD